MATEHTLHQEDVQGSESVWMGGKEPFKASYKPAVIANEIISFVKQHQRERKRLLM